MSISTSSVAGTAVNDVPPDVPGMAPSVASLGDQLMSCPIVVAVSGEADGATAARVASALEHRFGSRVSAVQVLDVSDLPLPIPLPTAFTVARELIGDAPYAADVRARREQFSNWLGAPNEWPVHVAVGAPAHQILRYAEHQGAALIVMGLRHHGIVDRVLHDETVLTVARLARGVVLAVAPTLHGLPRRAVVGIDFGPASIQAARSALDVLARPAPSRPVALRLVYVDRSGVDGAHEDTGGEALIKRLGVAAAGLLACAEESQADLIAVGSLRHERIERWILGSVTTEIIRDGRCSVLVIPPTHD